MAILIGTKENAGDVLYCLLETGCIEDLGKLLLSYDTQAKVRDLIQPGNIALLYPDRVVRSRKPGSQAGRVAEAVFRKFSPGGNGRFYEKIIFDGTRWHYLFTDTGRPLAEMVKHYTKN